MNIETGDKIYFHRNSPLSDAENSKYHYRTVRAVTSEGLKVYHFGLLAVVPFADVRCVKNMHVSRGKNELGKLMYKHGLRNEDVSEKSGYCVNTVDRARNERENAPKVKPRTLQDLLDTVKIMITVGEGINAVR